MKEYSKDDMKKGLDCYDPEKNVFPELGFSKAKQGRKLSKWDLLLILKWKLGRIKDSNSDTIDDDKMDSINKAVEDARKPGCKIDALKALDEIPGIGLATATAILTVCYPHEFTIIDQRMLEELELFPSRLAEHKRKKYDTDDWTEKDYIDEYVPIVKKCSERWGCTLRDADRALWGLSVNKQIEDFIAKNKRT